MSDQEKEQVKILQGFKNQTIGVIVVALFAALTMNYKFMSTIELVMQNFKENTETKFQGIDKKFESVDKRFDGVDRKIDKVEDKTDEIRRATVPPKDQVQEDRKKDPRF